MEVKEKTMEESKKATLTLTNEDGDGFIRISDDVVSNIAGLAATEVDGVSRLTGNVPGDRMAKRGKKGMSKGVNVIYEENRIRIDVSIVVKVGFNIVDVSGAVQEKVKQALQTMTGLTPAVVNVRVSGVDFMEKVEQ